MGMGSLDARWIVRGLSVFGVLGEEIFDFGRVAKWVSIG